VNQEWSGAGDAPLGMLAAATAAAAVLVPCVLACLLGQPRTRASSLLSDRTQRAALVVAHPDDEAMFFWPALLQLTRQGVHLSVLCLSTGNADGLGDVRRAEMERSCGRLHISGKDLVILDVDKLQDGFHEWPVEAVAGHVRRFLEDRQTKLVLTFDGLGVSGHPNHVSTSLGVRRAHDELRAAAGADACEVHMLESAGLATKYLGPLNLLLGARSEDALEWTCYSPLVCLQALAVHWSQLVWYRVLFTLFSRYAYVNSFVRYDTPPSASHESRPSE